MHLRRGVRGLRLQPQTLPRERQRPNVRAAGRERRSLLQVRVESRPVTGLYGCTAAASGVTQHPTVRRKLHVFFVLS